MCDLILLQTCLFGDYDTCLYRSNNLGLLEDYSMLLYGCIRNIHRNHNVTNDINSQSQMRIRAASELRDLLTKINKHKHKQGWL